MDNVIIDFTADTSGLTPAAEALKNLGQISDEQFAAFQKAQEQNAAALAALSAKQKAATEETQKATKSIADMASGAQKLTDTIQNGASEQAIKKISSAYGEAAQASGKLLTATEKLREQKAALEQQLAQVSAQFGKESSEAGALENQINALTLKIRGHALEQREMVRAGATSERMLGFLSKTAMGAGNAIMMMSMAFSGEGEESKKMQERMMKSIAIIQLLSAATEIATSIHEMSIVKDIAASQKSVAWDKAKEISGFNWIKAKVLGTATTQTSTIVEESNTIAKEANVAATEGEAIAETEGAAVKAEAAAATEGVTLAQWLWNAAVYASPIGWIAGIIIGFIAILYGLYEAIKIGMEHFEWLNKTVHAIGAAFSWVGDRIRDLGSLLTGGAIESSSIHKLNEELRETATRALEASKKMKDLADENKKRGDTEVERMRANGTSEGVIYKERLKNAQSYHDAIQQQLNEEAAGINALKSIKGKLSADEKKQLEELRKEYKATSISIIESETDVLKVQKEHNDYAAQQAKKAAEAAAKHKELVKELTDEILKYNAASEDNKSDKNDAERNKALEEAKTKYASLSVTQRRELILSINKYYDEQELKLAEEGGKKYYELKKKQDEQNKKNLEEDYKDEVTMLKNEEDTKLQALGEKFAEGKIKKEKYEEDKYQIELNSLNKLKALQETQKQEEISAADKTGESVEAINSKYAAKETETEHKITEITLAEVTRRSDAKKAALLKTIDEVGKKEQEVAGLISSEMKNESQQRINSITAEMTKLDQAHNKRLINDVQYAKQKQKLQDKETAEKQKLAKQEKIIKEGEAIANTALAITKILASQGVPEGIPDIIIAAGMGAEQFRTIQSAPGYAKGVESVEGPGTTTSDSIVARLSKKERVVTAEKNMAYWPTLQAIHHGSVDSTALNAFVENPFAKGLESDITLSEAAISKMMVMSGGISDEKVADKIGDRIADKIKALPQTKINLDKDGFSVFVNTAGNRKQYLGSRYRN